MESTYSHEDCEMANVDKAQQFSVAFIELDSSLPQETRTKIQRYNSAMLMAEYKDVSPVSHLGGWHPNNISPDENGNFLVEYQISTLKESRFLVAGYDTSIQGWYDKASLADIRTSCILRWKVI